MDRHTVTATKQNNAPANIRTLRANCNRLQNCSGCLSQSSVNLEKPPERWRELLQTPFHFLATLNCPLFTQYRALSRLKGTRFDPVQDLITNKANVRLDSDVWNQSRCTYE
jgi:hypothetical protein